ncbi:MAG: outer membrane protein TolC [Dokdonia sp.]|jgi:outer membrane protein TolC
MKLFAFILFILCAKGATGQNLPAYFEIIAENNPGLQSKYKEFESALQRTAQVTSLPEPTLSVGYFISPVETRVGPQRARFSLTQMFPWFGTLELQGEMATLMAEAKFQNFLDYRNQLYYKSSMIYFPLLELEELLKIGKENIRILESYKIISNVKFQNGKVGMVDVLRVDIMLKKAVADTLILSKKRKPLSANLNLLMNRDQNTVLTIEDSLRVPVIPLYEGDNMFVHNPNIQRLELQGQASKKAELLAEKQRYPKVGAGLDYVMVRKRTDMNLPKNGRDILMPMVSVSLPIFKEKYKAAEREAQLMQEAYAFEKKDVTNQLKSRFEMLWYDLETQKDLLNLYNRQTVVTRQSLDILLTAYGNSGKEFEELLRMQQELLMFQKQRVKAINQVNIFLAEIDYITAKAK